MKTIRILLAGVALLALAACTGQISAPVAALTKPAPTATLAPTETEVPTDTPEPTETEAPTETPTVTPDLSPKPSGPDSYPEGINPLTGLTAANPALLNRRPVGVKIQMFPRNGRPPMGISAADVVFEYYQNNGMTRLHALFYSQNAAQVGPIRSGRLFDATIIRTFQSLFAFGGADRRILSTLFNSEFSSRLIVEGAANCPPMCRIDPNGFNYLVTNTEELTKYAATKGVKAEKPAIKGIRYDPAAPAKGSPVTSVLTHYSISAYNRWDYDPAKGVYLRFQDTQETTQGGEALAPLTDKLNDQQLTAANVIVLVLPHTWVYRSANGNSEIVEITMKGKGTAYAFRDGQVYQLTWERPKEDATMFTLKMADGSIYPLKPGVTWYQVVGTTSKIKKGDAWRFDSSIP
jgi:hypothetical protein